MAVETINTKTVGEIVAGNYLMSEVFQKHGIDYCCQGEKTLAEVCLQKAIEPTLLEKELQEVANDRQRTYLFDQWQLDYLIDHILHTHHYYVWTNLPVLREYALKSFRMFGSQFPNLEKLNRLIVELTQELERHLKEEERLYFPYIRQLVLAERKIERYESRYLPLLEKSLDEIHADHIYLGSLFKMMDHLTDDYTLPDDGPSTLKVLFQKIKDFEEDFYQHVHLENNILFPKAARLEQEMSLVYQQ